MSPQARAEAVSASTISTSSAEVAMTATEQRIYSQSGEQEHILAAVAGIEGGRFLDIGAWHPTVFSNTRALWESGWSGVMIEPSPEPFVGLLREYGTDPRITLICAALGFERELATLHTTADAVSTTDTASYQRWEQAGGFYGTFLTPVITWADVQNRFGPFDFVSIDTEGTSVDLFIAMLKTTMFPRCVCIEHDDRDRECDSAAFAVGYRQIFRSAENAVYVR